MDVNDGDFITILGSNGAGKSTFFNVIAGKLPVSDGKIILGGKDITHEKEHASSQHW